MAFVSIFGFCSCSFYFSNKDTDSLIAWRTDWKYDFRLCLQQMSIRLPLRLATVTHVAHYKRRKLADLLFSLKNWARTLKNTWKDKFFGMFSTTRSSVPCRHWSRPLPTPELSGSAFGVLPKMATKNWKTEATLAENGWAWSAPALLWPGDGKTARYG